MVSDFDYFISHNRAEKAFAREMAQHLRARGARVFLDEDSIPLGGDIVASLESALQRSKHIVLILSPASTTSRWVTLEWASTLFSDPDASARRLIPVLLTDCKIPFLLGRLKYLDARGIRCVDCAELLLQHGSGLGLGGASARFYDISDWPLQGLEHDFECWSFGFTLVLAQCAPDAKGIAWWDFDRLHQRVRQWLRRDTDQRFVTATEGNDADDAEVDRTFSEELLLHRCRAEIVKDPITLGDVIQFRDGAPPQRLWAVLLERHRRALTTIFPGLRELAENGEHDLPSLRILAAQILGRIGEVDPHRITLWLVERWVRSDKGRHHAVIGPLFEGVIGSSSVQYRALCLRHLRQLRESGLAEGLHATVGVYPWIGNYDLPLAMREVGEIAREHLQPLISDMQQMGNLLADLEREMHERAGCKGDLENLITCQRLLRDLMDSVYKEKKDTLLGVQDALVSLCLTASTTRVLRELRSWIAAGGWKTGVLVALMFLHDTGIANALKAAKVEVDTEGSQGAYNPFVVCVAAGEHEVRQSARFLGDLYESLMMYGVDARLQHYCCESLQGHLLNWVRDAIRLPDYMTPMRSFFEALATTHDGIFRDPLSKLFARREFNSEPQMRAFAASVHL